MIIGRTGKLNELYFSGWGYFRTGADSHDEAVDQLLTALANAGVDVNFEELELRNLDGESIE